MVSAHIHRIARFGLDFGDLQSARRYSAWLVYARSKLANTYFADELAERLRGSGVTVNAMHPGAVATSLTRDWNPGPLAAIVARLGVPDPGRVASQLVLLINGAMATGLVAVPADLKDELVDAAMKLLDAHAR